MLKLFIIDGEYDWVDIFIRDAFSSDKLKVLGTGICYEDALENIAELRPDIVLLDQSIDGGKGLDYASKLVRQFDIPVYLTARHMGIDLWRKARGAGVAGTIKKPYSITDILESVAERLQEEAPKSTGSVINFRDRGNTKERLVNSRQGSTIVKQEIITFYSPKGGVGKTTLACNFAAALAAKSKLNLKVCLVDLDISFGNVEAVLQVEATKNTLDWEGFEPEEFDRSLIDELVTKHPLGLDLVLTPRKAHESAQIKGDLAEKILKALSRYYDVIIIDVGPSLQADSTVVALDLSTKILIIGTTDIPTLRNLHNCTKAFEDALGLDQSKIRMVFNRMMKKHGLSMREVNQYIPYPIIGKIFEEETVQRLANDGKLPVLHGKSNPFSESLLKTVNTIMPVCPEKKKGVFGWLKGRRASF